MGSNFPTDEGPIHQVYLNAFYMDVYEVTNALYRLCVEADACTLPQKIISYTYDDYPVIYVDWNQAQAYCAWREGNLPSEAQWEKAARGTDERVGLTGTTPARPTEGRRLGSGKGRRHELFIGHLGAILEDRGQARLTPFIAYRQSWTDG